MKQERSIRRLVRRETHSSRAAASALTAMVLAAVFLWLALESVLALLGEDPALASPGQLVRWLTGLPANTIPAGMVAAGAGLALLGLLLLGAALAGGRRSRRALRSDRSAVVVDDEVIAAAVSRRAGLAAGLSPGQVTTTVSGRSVRVRVRPTSGLPVDREAVQAAVDGELLAYQLDRRVSPTVQVMREGALAQ
ncbi:DUF6286 domain-containing protein [Pseudarthrobacter sp. 1C304]|uniref:DUF6286 domain-containing protein n=1 Tax=Pseudarthrobacter sp. 1C304 TaxID=3457438 RepID=UPI003FD61361